MRILILGGSRFMGRQLTAALLLRGDEVSIVNRGRTPDPFLDRVTRHVADRFTPLDLSRAVPAATGDYDAVVDFSAFRPAQSEEAAALLGNRVGHFIHVSSDAVYVTRTHPRNRPIVEADTALPPSDTPAVDAGLLAYAQLKLACEERLSQVDDLPLTILRLPIVQGPWDYTLRSWRYQLWLQSETAVDLPDAGLQRNTHVYSGDVVAGILACFEHRDEVRGETLNLAQGEAPSLREYLTQMATILGVRPAFRETELAGYLDGRRDAAWQPYLNLDGLDLVLGTDKAARLIDWRPTPMSSWLAATCEWFASTANPFTPPSGPPWQAAALP